MRTLAALVGLTVLMVYLATAGPTFHWLDSGELMAAGWGLGISHPPGHPLHALLTHLFCLLPVGTVAFRATLASSVMAAAAAGVVALLSFQIIQRLANRFPMERQCAAAGAAAAGLCFGLSFALWLQAVRTEVYALNVALVALGTLWVLQWDRSRDRRHLLLAVLCLCLALGNHHLLVLLGLCPLLLFVLFRRPWSQGAVARLLLGSAGFAALGGAIYCYLPLRAASGPLVNWGVPTTLSRFFWTVSAEAFQKTVERVSQAQSLTDRALSGVLTLFRAMSGESALGVVLVISAVAGLYLLLRSRPARPVGLLLLGLIGFNLLSPILVGLDPYNPDAHGYLAVSLAFLTPGLAVMLALLCQGLRRLSPRASHFPLVLALPVALGALNWNSVDLSENWAAEESGRALLEGMPSGSAVITSHFQTHFNLWAVRAAFDLRPDVDFVFRGFLAAPGYQEGLRLRGSRLAEPVEHFSTGFSLSVLAGLASRMPLWLEYAPELEAPVVERLKPLGLLQRLEAAPWQGAEVLEHRQRIARWSALSLQNVRDNETRRALVWSHYRLAQLACRRRWAWMARLHLEEARQLAPADLSLLALQRICLPAQ